MSGARFVGVKRVKASPRVEVFDRTRTTTRGERVTYETTEVRQAWTWVAEPGIRPGGNREAHQAHGRWVRVY